jgi:hypothetical protein
MELTQKFKVPLIDTRAEVGSERVHNTPVKDYIDAQGAIYSVGMAAFMSSFVLFGTAFLAGKNANALSWLFLLQGVLQTLGGTITMASVDLNVNKYLHANPNQMLVFMGLWIAGNGMAAFQPPQPMSQVLWLPVAPFLYLLITSQVCQDPHNVIVFTDYFARSLILFSVSQALWFVLRGHMLSPTWPYVYIGVFVAVASAVMVVAFYKATQWFPWTGDGKTIQSSVVLCLFLFSLGIQFAMQELLDLLIYHGTTLSWTLPAWLYPPLHIVGPILVLRYRQLIHGWIGTRWLQNRLRFTGTEFTLEEQERGNVDEIDREISSGLSATFFNEFTVESQSGDRYSTLHLAAGNGFTEGVEKLLALEGIDVDQNSPVCQRTPLYLAAQNGHVRVCELLAAHGALVNTVDPNDFSPLYIAALKGHTSVVKVLLLYGAAFNQVSRLQV